MTFEGFEKRILKNLPGSNHEDALHIWTGFCRSAAAVGTDIASVPATNLDQPLVWAVLKLRIAAGFADKERGN
jgi:hypothetical protein